MASRLRIIPNLLEVATALVAVVRQAVVVLWPPVELVVVAAALAVVWFERLSESQTVEGCASVHRRRETWDGSSTCNFPSFFSFLKKKQ